MGIAIWQLLSKVNNRLNKEDFLCIVHKCKGIKSVRTSKTEINEVVTIFPDIESGFDVSKMSFLFDLEGNLKSYKAYFGG